MNEETASLSPGRSLVSHWKAKVLSGSWCEGDFPVDTGELNALFEQGCLFHSVTSMGLALSRGGLHLLEKELRLCM